MKIQCEACENAEASVFCCADEAALCTKCDSRVHEANKLANKHPRVSLEEPYSSSTGTHPSPRCDICQERRAFFFCLEDRAILCRDCDFSVHSANALTAKHGRLLISGIRVSLQAIDMSSVPAVSAASPQKKKGRKMAPFDGSSTKPSGSSMSKTSQASSAVSVVTDYAPESSNLVNLTGSREPPVSTAGGISGSSISEYLTQTIPGWCIEEFLGSDSPERLEWSATDHGLSKGDDLGKLLDQGWTADLEFPHEGFYVEGEVPQVPSTPTTSGVCSYGRFGITLKVKERQSEHGILPYFQTIDDTFMVPDMGLTAPSTKRVRPFWQI